jgi:hypothetical protein
VIVCVRERPLRERQRSVVVNRCRTPTRRPASVTVGATKICCDQQMSDAEACQRYALLGEAAVRATKIYCDQQMSDAEACQRYALLGDTAVGATKICCDQQMSDAEACQYGLLRGKCVYPKSSVKPSHYRANERPTFPDRDSHFFHGRKRMCCFKHRASSEVPRR